MLDIRAVAYVAPVSEVDFASVALTVRLVNFADETGLVSGKFRVYNNSTGLLIHTSDIVPISMGPGATVDADALTDFDPPAPADDTYFVVFDGVATNALVPDGITISLSQFYFDVKPTGMGPAPAAHHATHEDGGSDEIDVTDLSGLLADAQTPILHASSHESGGSDEIDLDGLTGLDHHDLDGLLDDDHTQYRLRHEILLETDFFDEITSGYNCDPWYSTSIRGSFSVQGTPTADHPGILEFWGNNQADSGFRAILNQESLLLAGGETSKCWHMPVTLAGTTRHAGFHDATTETDPVDGAWIWQDPADGKIYGRTRSNSVGSTTGTGYQLVTNTWYLEKIVINADATRVDFYLYDNTGALLWTDNLTTNIPTAAARVLGHGIVTTNSGTTPCILDRVDYLSALIPDRRPNI